MHSLPIIATNWLIENPWILTALLLAGCLVVFAMDGPTI